MLFVWALLLRIGLLAESSISGKIENGEEGDKGPNVRDEGRTDATLKVVDCQFTASVATSDGGSIYSRGSGQLSIENCFFADTQAGGKGGAVFVDGPGPCSFTHCVFDKTVAISSGGAFWVKCESDVTIEFCRTANACQGASAEGALGHVQCGNQDSESGAVFKMNSNHFESEQEVGEGCVLFTAFYDGQECPQWLSSVRFFNCTFDGKGKAVQKLWDLQPAVGPNGCVFSFTFESLHFKNIVFTEEKAACYSGRYALENLASGDIEDVTFKSCTFTAITGKDSACIWAGPYTYLLTIDGCTFTDCHCEYYGPVLTIRQTDAKSLSVTNCRMEGTFAKTGAIIHYGSENRFADNVVDMNNVTLIVNGPKFDGPILYFRHAVASWITEAGYFKAVTLKSVFVSHVTFSYGWLFDIFVQKFTYQDCIFNNVSNVFEGGSILLGPRTEKQGSLSSSLTATNCSFLNCHSMNGALLFALDNDNDMKWTLTVNNCRFVSCSAKTEIIAIDSVDNERRVLVAEVTGTQFSECKVTIGPVVRLNASDRCVFNSNSITGLYGQAVSLETTSPTDLELSDCSFDNGGAAVSNGYLSFASGGYTVVSLDNCSVSNMIMTSKDVFLFMSPAPTSLEELRLVDCVFDNLRMEQANMITAVQTLVVSGSTFRSCTSPTGVIYLNEQAAGVTIERSVFDANTREADGQSVYMKFSDAVTASSLNISDSVFSGHSKYAPFSVQLAGALLQFGMSNCTFSNNNITESLGVLCFDGSDIEYTFSECVFSECSVESEGGQLIWLPSTGKAFSQFVLQFCEFTSCGSGSVIGSTSEQNGDLVVDNCSVTNTGFSLAFSCSRATFSKCYFLVSDSTAEATIKLSVRGETVFSDSTFIFVDNAADTKRAMIQYVGEGDAKATFRDCCFATDVIPASQFVAFLSLEGQGSYTFEGSMCFDLPNSRAVRASRGIVGSEESMFACGNCTRRGGDLNDDGSAKKGQLPPGAIAGIVIVVLLILVLLLLLALYIIRKRRYANRSTTHTEEDENPEETMTTTADTTSGGSYGGPGFMSEENPLWREDGFGTADQTFEEHVV